MTIDEVNNKLIEISLQEFKTMELGDKFPSYKNLATRIGCSQKSVEKSQKMLEELGCFKLQKNSSSSTILVEKDITRCIDIYNLDKCFILLPYTLTLKLEAISSAFSNIIDNEIILYENNSANRINSLINGNCDITVIPKSYYNSLKEMDEDITLMFEFGEKSYADYHVVMLKGKEPQGNKIGVDYNNIDHINEIFTTFNYNNCDLVPIRINKIKEALVEEKIDFSIVDVDEIYMQEFETRPANINDDSLIAVAVCRSDKFVVLSKYYRFEEINNKRMKIINLEEIPNL